VGGELVEIEAPARQRHVAGIVPIRQVDVVIGKQRAQRAAQQRREMARHRRDHQDARLRRHDILPEMKQRAEGRGVRHRLDDRDLAVLDITVSMP